MIPAIRTATVIAAMLLGHAAAGTARAEQPVRELVSGEMLSADAAAARRVDLYTYGAVAGTPVEIDFTTADGDLIVLFNDTGDIIGALGKRVVISMPRTGAYVIAVSRPAGAPAYTVMPKFRDPTLGEYWAWSNVGYIDEINPTHRGRCYSLDGNRVPVQISYDRGKRYGHFDINAALGNRVQMTWYGPPASGTADIKVEPIPNGFRAVTTHSTGATDMDEYTFEDWESNARWRYLGFTCAAYAAKEPK